MTAAPESLLAVLDGAFRRGGADEVALTRLLNHAIDVAPTGESLSRRRVLAAAGGALAHRARSLALGHALHGRFRKAYRLGFLAAELNDFVFDLVMAAPDPDADILRVRILELRCLEAGEPDLRALSRAMGRTALAGSHPVRQNR